MKNGYVRESTTLDEAIGPWQVVDGMLWFAKSLSDGEGPTGVGGFGYFDVAGRTYHIDCPAEIADWSATAMLVERDAVWLALANRGEYGDTGGGLLRFDRATRQVERWELHELVNEIARVGDGLVLATDVGAALLMDGEMRRFFVDRGVGGGLEVREAVGSGR